MNESVLRIALVGNPNAGKTALFNRLTGGRQKVANYAGVTVDCKVGQLCTPNGRQVRLLDLPGVYSFDSNSADEATTYDVLCGRHHREPAPEAIIFVLDATNLRLHLRLLLDVRRLGLPILVALNMVDQARRQGIVIDVPRLAQRLAMPVLQTVAVQHDGAVQLLAQLDQTIPNVNAPLDSPDHHVEVRAIMADAVHFSRITQTLDDRIDRWALHPVSGLIILTLVMFLTFQAVYAVGKPMTELIGVGLQWLGTLVTEPISDGPLKALLQEGIFGGLGSLLGFLPQILILFFFILILEDSGYLPRAAFLLDRSMLTVGLSGRAFIPLLSSFACAIPSILGTRSIPDTRDRLVTILIAPLMTCSARLPVYALLIGAFIPHRAVLKVFNLQGIVLFLLYAAGIAAALTVAYIGKQLRRQHEETTLLMELPPYRIPHWGDVAKGLVGKLQSFLKRLAGIMLALTIMMWFICRFPEAPLDAARPAIEYSLAGMLGQWIQPIFVPLGFSWQITVALIPAFAAREAAVATLATVYSVAAGQNTLLSELLASQLSTATALSLMVWFAFAPQCMSTLAVIKRETGNWRVVCLSFFYMFVLAYLAAWLTYQLAVSYL